MKIIVYGIVQGVGFRPAVHRLAAKMKLDGYVHNLGSCVEICVSCDPDDFVAALKADLPPLARIDRYEIKPGKPPKKGFFIARSGDGDRSSLLPVDVALCSHCRSELTDPDNRRYRYPFTNCTDCGARYTVIRETPYDRERTAMAQFPRCSKCKNEYVDMNNRRFHAQTSSCPRCGPHYTLFDEEGHDMDVRDLFTVFAAHIDEGHVGLLKGWGGAHAVCSVDHIDRLRDAYERPQKPFAVMVRNIEKASEFAELDERSRGLLTSPQAPITLVPKKRGVKWADHAAPGLDRVGLFLPYAAGHHLLFDSLGADAVVMTSANLPGQPMTILNQDCLKLPGEIYLLHNRQIVHRMDDSVVLPHKNGHYFLRKSRGHVPLALPLPHDKTLVAVGGDMNGTGCLAVREKGIATQFIGDVGNYDVSLFLEKALETAMTFSGVATEDVDGVVVDLHPRYGSRRVGKHLASEWDVPLLEVQHHAAHMYALAGEHKRTDMVALACDGTGYGTDGTIWGGEVLATGNDGFERLGRLCPIPLLGGEKAVEEPTRLVAAACWMLGLEQPYYSGDEAEVLEKMVGTSVVSSSSGRFLDLLSSWLGVCATMTYDGEPAMALEKYLARGSRKYKFEVETIERNGILEVDTFGVLSQLADVQRPLPVGETLKTKEIADLAVSIVRPVFEALSDIASDAAQERELDEVGFTGGVSYNLVLDKWLDTRLRKNKTHLLRHCDTPNGDGGVAYGQAVWGGLQGIR